MKFLFVAVFVLLSFQGVLSECNKCNVNGRVACISTTQFFLCTNGVPDTSLLLTCPTGKKCANADTGCSDVVAADCNSAILSVQDTPIAACTVQGTVGRFPNNSDKTCTKYFYCFMKNGALTGLAYTCVGTTLFDPTKQLCVTNFKCI